MDRIDRFISKTRKMPSGCIKWQCRLDRFGYGDFSIKGKDVRAHRVSYEFFRGPIPTGLKVLHECDNPSCVNPVHLFLGTNKDNSADMVRKGRQRKGEGVKSSKLTSDDIRSIRARRGAGEGCKEIATTFGINRSTVSKICKLSRWSHIS